MKYYAFIVGDKTYNLRLTTLMTIRLEQVLGKNPLNIFIGEGEAEQLPTLEEMITCLYFCLQAEHKKDYPKIEDVYPLFDEYIDEGGSMISFVEVLLEVFKVSGLVPDEDTDTDEKN